MSQNTNFSSEYIIADEVLATIAVNAAKDVEGVAALGTRPLVDLFSAGKLVAEDLKHAAITVTSYDIKVHLYLELTSNARIQEVCSNVQKAVKKAIQNMTGKVVTRVDVTITGVSELPVETDSTPVPKDFNE